MNLFRWIYSVGSALPFTQPVIEHLNFFLELPNAAFSSNVSASLRRSRSAVVMPVVVPNEFALEIASYRANVIRSKIAIALQTAMLMNGFAFGSLMDRNEMDCNEMEHTHSRR